MAVEHWYIPSPGQSDAAERAAALGLPLADTTKGADYGSPSLPAVVCDHDGLVLITPEPTTFAAVWAAHDQLTAPASPFTLDVNEAGDLLTISVTYADGTTTKSGAVALE